MLSIFDLGSPAVRWGLSDVSICNLFIIPMIAFLIVFNIFPLIYSLGYSFIDFRVSSSVFVNFVGLQNYCDLLNDKYVWNNFSVIVKYVFVLVGGQVLVGFSVVMLLNCKIAFKGFIIILLFMSMIATA